MLFIKEHSYSGVITIVRTVHSVKDTKVQDALGEYPAVAYIGGGVYGVVDEDDTHILVDLDRPIR